MTIRMTALAFASTIVLALPALAQDAPPPPGHEMGPDMMGHMGMMGGCHEGMLVHELIAHHPDGGLAFLRAELKITPREDGAFASFSAAIHQSMDRRHPEMDAQRKEMRDGEHGKALPEILARHEEVAARHLAKMKAMDATVLALYRSLDADQQKKADHMFAPCGPGMMGPRGMGPHGMGPHGMGPHGPEGEGPHDGPRGQ